MKQFILLLLVLTFNYSFSQNPSLILRGKNYGRNLIVSNPFAASGVGFSILEIRINGKVSNTEIAGSVFEIDFLKNKIPMNDSLVVQIIHKLNSTPQIYNPEAITNPSVEPIPSLDHSSQTNSYYLNDKSLCIIKGKVLSDKPYNSSKPYNILVALENGIVSSFLTTDQEGGYIVLLHFDRLYELQILDQTRNKAVKKIFLNLKGVPEEKKKGQLIYVNFALPKSDDPRIQKLNSEFPSNKLYYDPISQTLKWDEDFSNAISRASEILIKQIGQEKNLNEIEFDRKLKLLEIEKNKLDLSAKTSEINIQKSELAQQNLDKKLKENEIKAKSLLIEDEKNKKKYLYAIIGFIILITIGSLFAFLRQRKLKKLVDLQKIEADRQRHLVEEKQKEIIDSIHYAKRIQTSLLPTEKYIDKNFKRFMKR